MAFSKAQTQAIMHKRWSHDGSTLYSKTVRMRFSVSLYAGYEEKNAPRRTHRFR